MLRLLAGTSYIDLAMIFGLAKATIYQCFLRIVSALLAVLPMDGFPETEEAVEKLSMRFSTSRALNSPLHDCVGALYGIAIQIMKPRECNDPAQYWCRTGFYGLPAQADADYKYRFTHVSVKCVGAMDDYIAFSVSPLANNLQEGAISENYWYAGDDACVCSECILSLITTARAPPRSPEDAFNFYHSSLRMLMEQAFRIYSLAGGIFEAPFASLYPKSEQVVVLATKLHH